MFLIRPTNASSGNGKWPIIPTAVCVPNLKCSAGVSPVGVGRRSDL